MIRRRVDNEFFLIAQHDHALLAGELAAHVGNRSFDRPTGRRESFLLAVAQHDCGWPLHDESPTLNREHFPIDVFESTREIALKVWSASVDRVLATGDKYAALLVSLHVLALSAFAIARVKDRAINTFDVNDSRARFELNRFQHKQLEIQEQLRAKLNLPTYEPMRQGLVEETNDPGELELQFHFRLLQAMDLISLGLCCTDPPVDQIRPVLIRPGGKSVVLNLKRDDPTTLRISPWPFDEAVLTRAIAYRRVPAQAFEADAMLQNLYSTAVVEQLQFTVLPGQK